MAGNIQDISKELHRVTGITNENSNAIGDLRQFSHAKVVSVYRDFQKCDIVLLKNGIGIEGAVVAMHPNDLNILGYPKIDDIVLVYHQNQSGDCHIVMRLTSKIEAFYKQTTYAQNCPTPANALAG